MKINAHAFAAVHQVVSNQETRFYLQGVYVEPTGELVAIDGHSMLVAKLYDSLNLPSRGVIVKADKNLITAAKKQKADAIIFSENIAGIATVLDENGAALGAGNVEIIDGTFPNWSLIFELALKHEEPSKQRSSFSCNMIATLCVVAKIASGSRDAEIDICCQGLDPSPVRFPRSQWLTGVIVSIRS